MNGHASPSPDEYNAHMHGDSQSDSDLSDAQPAAADVASPESADAVGSPDPGAESGLEDQEEDYDTSQNGVRDDGDLDAAGSPASMRSNDAAGDAPSALSRTAAKRKTAQTIEDEYIRGNPELYGLRRSVC